jgi:hypothetical protein
MFFRAVFLLNRGWKVSVLTLAQTAFGAVVHKRVERSGGFTTRPRARFEARFAR